MLLRPGLFFCLALICLSSPLVSPHAAESYIQLAAGPAADKPADGDKDDDKEELTPEQKMQKRFPQPVRVGDLIGLPVLDEGDSTIGYVREVVRTAENKVVLIVPYSAWFGWARTERGKRPVAVPIEAVAILARQINAVDMGREDFEEAPNWDASRGKTLPVDDNTLIALGRR
ncbi:MAG: PRC-barrel domain-containing protein [Pseudolabrys sp.]|nr:PRC-barrel domain-containing protein [Pseudolabrys sp.]